MIQRTLILFGLALAVSGCVIVTDREDDWYDDGDNTSWQREQSRNRNAIERLSLGASLDAVRADLGRPEFTESFTRDGHEYRVLRYRTHHRHSDGETTADETTPLVFRDGELIGWGETVMREYL